MGKIYTMDKAPEQTRKQGPPLIKGLSEKQVKTLYSLASIRKLHTEQVLIKQGDTDQVFYLILDGEIRIERNLAGNVDVIETMGRGKWVGEIAFTKKIPRTASAVAIEPSTVMAIEKSTFETLDENAQLVLLKHLSEMSSERIKKLEAREGELIAKNRRLMSQLFTTYSNNKADYKGSEKIRSIIGRIPRLPVFAETLIPYLFEDRGSAKEITEQVKQDPALIGMIMKTINSAYYGFRGKISGIHHAIVLLGNNGLNQLIMAEGVRRTMPDKPFYGDLHTHSIAISNISYAISLQTKVGKPTEIATVGLLHDLGKAVIELLKEQNSSFAFLLDSLDPARMGSLLLKNWNLPKVIWKTVEFQRLPEFSPPSKVPPEVRPNVALLCVAHGCYMILTGLREEDVSIAFIDEYQHLLNWGSLSLSQITHDFILPNLIKNKSTFPQPFRQFLMQASEDSCMSSYVKGERP
jgi:HD-like signal output (HDOD) protein